MNDALFQQATAVRSDFSTVMDKAIYEKPQLISRTKDQLVLVGTEMLNKMLLSSTLHVRADAGDGDNQIYQLEEIPDILTEAASESEALDTLSSDVLEYAKTYYGDFALYSHAPNRIHHLPYVMRALALGTPAKVREMLICQAGKS